jgi:hypothetical protein
VCASCARFTQTPPDWYVGLIFFVSSCFGSSFGLNCTDGGGGGGQLCFCLRLIDQLMAYFV